MSSEPEKKAVEVKDVAGEPEAGGPLGAVAGRSPGSDLRVALVAAFRDAIDDARASVTEKVVDDAVHECRKALRRARSTVRLVAGTLGRDDRRDLRRALRDARRLLSASRDVAALPGALAALDIEEPVHGAVVAIVSAGRAAAPPAEETRKLLDEAIARVATLPDMMAAALPAKLDWDDLADGLADTYRDARRAMKKARRSRSAFHAVKRRTKELASQLELLAGGLDGRTDALRKRFADLGDELGDTVDEIMLRSFVDDHSTDRSADDRASILDAIDAHLHARMGTGRKAARSLFERRPRRFAAKVGKALRRDHAPADVPAPAPAPN
jgi:CHAD domain-containing protein